MDIFIITIKYMFLYQPGLLALTIMLFYAWSNSMMTSNTKAISASFIIFFALFLQYKSAGIQLFEAMKMENRIQYLESVLLENNITSKKKDQFIKNEDILNGVLKILHSEEDNVSIKIKLQNPKKDNNYSLSE